MDYADYTCLLVTSLELDEQARYNQAVLNNIEHAKEIQKKWKFHFDTPQKAIETVKSFAKSILGTDNLESKASSADEFAKATGRPIGYFLDNKIVDINKNPIEKTPGMMIVRYPKEQ